MSNPPPRCALIAPTLVEPSPQSIVALKSTADARALTSVKWATLGPMGGVGVRVPRQGAGAERAGPPGDGGGEVAGRGERIGVDKAGDERAADRGAFHAADVVARRGEGGIGDDRRRTDRRIRPAAV